MNFEACLKTLNSGGLVLFPTDTVYGILVRSDFPQSVERLYTLKGRRPDKPLVRLVAHLDFEDPDLCGLSWRAQRLIRSLWPGPLTVVGASGNSLRWPDHQLLNEFVRQAQGPVVATSANISDQPEPDPGELKEVSTAIRQGVDDFFEGSCAGGKASTVLRFHEDSYEILRPGPLREELLQYLWCTRIAFVCTGNTCRSPMAEGAARSLLQQELRVNDITQKNLWVESAGIFAAEADSASNMARKVMEQRGLDISSHRSRGVTRFLVQPPDFLYGMTHNHVVKLQELGLTAQCLHPEGQDIEDPYGKPLDHYQSCFESIESCLQKRLKDWIGPVSNEDCSL